MMVILRENVPNLGRIGDVVKVTDGYARNFLLPRKLVAQADEGNMAMINHWKKRLEKKRVAQKALATELAKKLADVTCNISKKVGENDKIFGSVTTAEIAAFLHKLGHTSIDRHQVILEAPIKALGVHTVNLRLDAEVTAPLKVWVVKEE